MTELRVIQGSGQIPFQADKSTHAGADNIIDYAAKWYEHTDKTQVF